MPPRTLNAPVGLRFSHFSDNAATQHCGKLGWFNQRRWPQVRSNGASRLEHVGKRRDRPARRALHRCSLSSFARMEKLRFSACAARP